MEKKSNGKWSSNAGKGQKKNEQGLIKPHFALSSATGVLADLEQSSLSSPALDSLSVKWRNNVGLWKNVMSFS